VKKLSHQPVSGKSIFRTWALSLGAIKKEISGATLFAQSCSRCVKYRSTMTVSGAASNVCFGSSSEVVVNPLRVREIVVRRFERNKKAA
jgi:hypothetical protein